MGMVVGRFFWDKACERPTPWMSFPNITAYRKWLRDVRKARPGTKGEFGYVDSIWTAQAMLENVRTRRRGEPE